MKMLRRSIKKDELVHKTPDLVSAIAVVQTPSSLAWIGVDPASIQATRPHLSVPGRSRELKTQTDKFTSMQKVEATPPAFQFAYPGGLDWGPSLSV
jgi:hypothetical protein